MTSSTHTVKTRTTNKMPFGRWFAEIGWRHLVGVLALVFAAGAVMTMIPVIALFQYLQKYIVGGATAGAVKG